MPGKDTDLDSLRDMGSTSLISEMEDNGMSDFEIENFYAKLCSKETQFFSEKV